MPNLAIIPARRDSGRIKDRNVHLFAGRPLVLYTIAAVLKSNQFDTVLVTSDSDEVLEIAATVTDSRLKSEKRNRDLTTDTATVLDVVNEVVSRYAASGESFDRVGQFLPTAPFRTSADIVKAVKRLDPGVDSVVSVAEYEFPPQLALSHDADNMLHACDPSDPFGTNRTRSKDYPKRFHPNGAIYVSWWKSFLVHRNFFKGKVASYYMPRKLSLNIEDDLDVIVGEAALEFYGIEMDLAAGSGPTG